MRTGSNKRPLRLHFALAARVVAFTTRLPPMSQDVRVALEKRGEKVTEQKWLAYGVQAIAFDGNKRLPRRIRANTAALAE